MSTILLSQDHGYNLPLSSLQLPAKIGHMALDLFGNTGKRIKALRTSRDINQKELVVALKKQGVDVGPSFISQVESNRKQPPIELLVGLAKVLGTTTDYLLMVTNDPTPNASTDSQLIIDVPDRSDRALLEGWIEVMEDVEPERRESILRSVRLLLSPGKHPPPRTVE